MSQDRTRTQQLNLTLRTFDSFQLVDTLSDTFFSTFWHSWHVVVFVQSSDVVVNVFLLFTVHSFQTVVHDNSNFVSVSWVVRDTVWDSQRLDVRVTVFVLQTFTVQSSSTRSTTDQETSSLLVTSSPTQVTDSLETEHRVVDVEWDHWQVVSRVRSSSSQPRTTSTQFVDTFLQDLTLFVFLVVSNLFSVLWSVLLTVWRVDTDLSEQTFHTESSSFVSDDWNQSVLDRLVLQHNVQSSNESDSSRDFLRLFFQQSTEVLQRWQFQLFSEVWLTRWQVTVQLLSLSVQVSVFFRTFWESDVWQLFDVSVRNWNVESVSDVSNTVHVHLLNLVSDVLTFSSVTHTVTLDSVSQDNSSLTLSFLSLLESSVDLLWVVTTSVQSPDLFVSPVSNQSSSFWVLTEEVFSNVSTVLRLESLVVTVNSFVHQLDQLTRSVLSQQFVPTRTPHNLDNVPTSTFEDTFQFVDDLTVTSNWTVQSLQVTVDNENQVVQLFSSSDSDSTLRFWFVHFTVTQESVNSLLRSVLQTSVFQVLQELSLVDSTDWTQTHRNSWELPKFWHQLWVWVRRQTVTVNFLSEVVQLFLSQSTFQESSSVNTWRDVTLEVNQVTTVLFVSSSEEVVETNVVDSSRRLERSHVTTQFQVLLRSSQNSHDSVPSDSRSDSSFQFQVTWVFWLFFNWDSVDVVRDTSTSSNVNTTLSSFSQQLVDQVLSSFNTFFSDNRFDSLQPVSSFDWVNVVWESFRHFVCLCVFIRN
ncbi:hypothetical protein bwei_5856 [Bacillus mycoides]|nr:hypothetical protein bwei_5856 [Bacillus mycoides]EME04865.1 hypothetical protein BS732_4460 [Bacillus subtilis MB73/2]